MAYLDNDILLDIEQFVEENDHTEAYATIASGILNDAVLTNKFVRIGHKQDALGYLSHELNAERFELYTKMMAQVKAVFDDEDYKKVYGAL